MLKRISTVFLVLFVLVKISPNYFNYVFIPAFTTVPTVAAIKQLRAKGGENLLFRADKAIANEINDRVIPKIKFTGLLFKLLFNVSGLFFLASFTTILLMGCQSPTSEKYIFQHSFRL
jgi:hypothetical protein